MVVIKLFHVFNYKREVCYSRRKKNNDTSVLLTLISGLPWLRRKKKIGSLYKQTKVKNAVITGENPDEHRLLSIKTMCFPTIIFVYYFETVLRNSE